VISGFLRNVNEIPAVEGFYAAPNGSLPTFRNIVGPILKGQGVKVVSQAFQVLDCLAADNLSRNVG
jgi:hypothetical protein